MNNTALLHMSIEINISYAIPITLRILPISLNSHDCVVMIFNTDDFFFLVYFFLTLIKLFFFLNFQSPDLYQDVEHNENWVTSITVISYHTI